MILQTVLLGISLLVSLLFFLYGFNHYYLIRAARHYQPPAPEDPLQTRPGVSIHLPIYNERHVIHRLLEACTAAARAYGMDKVRLLILDDSNDETTRVIDEAVEGYRGQGFQMEVLRRDNRQGFKAGALQAALEKTPEEFIAIFDADFVPAPDFLLRAIPHLVRNERLAIIQGRWTHTNRDANLLTQAVAHAIDVHFLIEQPGRYAAGIFQNFNGSGGILRKKAIVEAGGWQSDTLAEDLDLSYRMQILGYEILYLEDLECPGEIPPTLPGIKQQQSRWACGAMRTARKILPRLPGSPNVSFKRRFQALLHLTGYMIQPLMVLAFLVSVLATLWKVDIFKAPALDVILSAYDPALAATIPLTTLAQELAWLIFVPLIGVCTLAPWISLVSTLKMQRLSLPGNLASLGVLLLLSFGISLSTTLGVGKGLFFNRDWTWNRSPKYAGLQDRSQSRYQVPLDAQWVIELAFVLLGLWAIGAAIRQTNFNVLVILVPFTLSYGFVFIFSILQSRKA
jgi:cellulose synthase/poly-beta-1,6-N-acetylglucosamine synthase-like glycosyltransferase